MHSRLTLSPPPPLVVADVLVALPFVVVGAGFVVAAAAEVDGDCACTWRLAVKMHPPRWCRRSVGHNVVDVGECFCWAGGAGVAVGAAAVVDVDASNAAASRLPMANAVLRSTTEDTSAHPGACAPAWFSPGKLSKRRRSKANQATPTRVQKSRKH